MNTIKVNDRNEIPKDAKIGEVYETGAEFLKWEICRNWCGTVFAAQVDLNGYVFDGCEEIVLRQDW